MVFYDPLGHLRLPVFGQEIVAFSLNFGFRALPFHFHEVMLSFSIYNIIFILSRILSPVVFKSYKTMTPKNQLNFDIHVVSMIQSIAILALSAPLFNDPVLSRDHVDGYTPYCGFVIAMAAGYFLWDCFICIRHVKLFGVGFLVHGIGSLFVFIQGLRPFVQYYAPIFLLFELSTPFVNIHWFASHMPQGTIPEWVQKINGVILLITFPACRIVWGFYQAARLAQDVLHPAVRSTHPTWISVSILFANVSLSILNVYWFFKMIKAVKRRLKQSSEHPHPLVEKKTR